MAAFVEVTSRGAPAAVIVSIPHTGTEVPAEVKERFASESMLALPMTDWHLHRLYDFLPALGITTIHARFSRLVADLNRAPDSRQLYPGRFETGLVPLETFDGERIFSEAPAAATIESLQQQYHQPYHDRLSELLQDRVSQFGRVVLIDAHSVASRANKVHAALEDDIYLGDRDGETCEPWLTGLVESGFKSAGLRVCRNAPYKGGYITQHYGNWPEVDALQIEMCQRLYMDEDNSNIESKENWNRMKTILLNIMTSLTQQLAKS